MFSKFKITEFLCMADNFCKEFVLQQGKYMIEDKRARHRTKNTETYGENENGH